MLMTERLPFLDLSKEVLATLFCVAVKVYLNTSHHITSSLARAK